ncbi:hypothetical protein MBLNU457_g0248t1 [Dothideomycetes sp. NU457]
METLKWADISGVLSDSEAESVLRPYEEGTSTNAWCVQEVVEAYAYTYKRTSSLVYNSSPLHSRSRCRSRSLPLTGSSLSSRSLPRLDSLPRFHSLSSKFCTPIAELLPNYAIRSTLETTMSTMDGFVDVQLHDDEVLLPIPESQSRPQTQFSTYSDPFVVEGISDAAIRTPSPMGQEPGDITGDTTLVSLVGHYETLSSPSVASPEQGRGGIFSKPLGSTPRFPPPTPRKTNWNPVAPSTPRMLSRYGYTSTTHLLQQPRRVYDLSESSRSRSTMDETQFKVIDLNPPPHTCTPPSNLSSGIARTMPCALVQRYPESPCTPLLPVLEEPATVHNLPALDTGVSARANAPYRGHHRRVSSREIFSYIANHGHESQFTSHGHAPSDIALTNLERGPYTQLDSTTTNTTFPPLDRSRTNTTFPPLSFTQSNTTYPRSLERSATYTQHPSVHSSVYRTQSRSERSAGYWFLVGLAALLPPLSLMFGFGVFDPFLTWVRHGRLPDISRHKRIALMLAWVLIGVVVGAAVGVGIAYGRVKD